MQVKVSGSPYATCSLDSLHGQKLLIVASTGGHLSQAVRWAERFGVHRDSVFVTFDSPQSRSLLANRRYVFLPYVAPRDWRGVLRFGRSLPVLAKREGVDAILSTGAGVALGCLAARRRGRPFYYLESVSRFHGPSLTGRVLALVPGVRRGTQHPSWSSRRWPYVGSLLTDYRVAVSEKRRDDRPLRLFVTLGTIAPYRFDRLVDRVVALLEPNDQVMWQLGSTVRDDLPGTCFLTMTHDQYLEAASTSDAVISHSGVGTILDLLEAGVSPVVVPRRKEFGEHVDDHQEQVASALASLGLVTSVEANELVRSVLSNRPCIVSDLNL